MNICWILLILLAVEYLFAFDKYMTVKIDNVLLDSLTVQAKASPRLRMNYDLRNSAADSSQRMLNAIEPGSVIPIHRHQKTSETVVVLRGRVVEEFYAAPDAEVSASDVQEAGLKSHDDSAISSVPICTASYEVSPAGPICALNIPAGTWHTLRSLESGTVILEMKDGPFIPTSEEDIMPI